MKWPGVPRENSAGADLWLGHFQILFPFPQLHVLALKIHFLFIDGLPPLCCLLEFLRSVRQFDGRHLHNNEAGCSGWLKCTYKGFCGTKEEETCGRDWTVLGGRSSVLSSPHEVWVTVIVQPLHCAALVISNDMSLAKATGALLGHMEEEQGANGI